MIFIFLTAYVTLSNAVRAANILYVAPFPSVSHYQMMEPLMLSLAQRGHQITVLSHYPQPKPVSNYSDITLRGVVTPYELNFTSWAFLDDVVDLFAAGAAQCEGIVSSAPVQAFLREDRTFDLIFLDVMDSDCYLGFVVRYPAPYVLCSSLPLPVWLGDWVFNPVESSYVPDPMCRVGGRMDFLARARNLLCQALLRALNYAYNARAVDVVRRHFRVDVDTLDDVKRNVGMVFVNSFNAFAPVRPFLPNVVELGGIHIRERKSLPEKIEKFLNESTDGVIVFSMGSMVKAHTLDPAMREAFVTAFRRLEQRVLWKWETEMEDCPGNVMVVDWMPQSDVLAHPNVRLFMSHGGIHGVMEAVHHGVPILGIPLYGDQDANLQHLESAGAATRLQLQGLTPERVMTAIDGMLRTRRYAEKAKALSRVMRDRPLPPLELAVYWTEYLLRNGPPRSPTSHLHWSQYFLIDVWIACVFFCAFWFFIFYFSLRFLRII